MAIALGAAMLVPASLLAAPRSSLLAAPRSTLLAAPRLTLRAAPQLPWYGDYLETMYARVLAQTKSPSLASAALRRDGAAEMLSVQAQRDGRRITLTTGWSSVQAVLLLQRDGVARRELAWGHVPDLALRQPDATTLCLTAPRGAEHCYKRVGDALGFVTRTVLAGSYTDRQGALYRFGTDGVAHFPGQDFHYGLALDLAAARIDAFEIGTSGQLMAFQHTGSALTLFSVPNDGAQAGRPDYAHRLAVLQPRAHGLLASN